MGTYTRAGVKHSWSCACSLESRRAAGGPWNTAVGSVTSEALIKYIIYYTPHIMPKSSLKCLSKGNSVTMSDDWDVLLTRRLVLCRYLP
jgi:hypothetical protein